MAGSGGARIPGQTRCAGPARRRLQPLRGGHSPTVLWAPLIPDRRFGVPRVRQRSLSCGVADGASSPGRPPAPTGGGASLGASCPECLFLQTLRKPQRDPCAWPPGRRVRAAGLHCGRVRGGASADETWGRAARARGGQRAWTSGASRVRCRRQRPGRRTRAVKDPRPGGPRRLSWLPSAHPCLVLPAPRVGTGG